MADEEKKPWFTIPAWLKAIFTIFIAVGGYFGGDQIKSYVKGEPGFFEQQALTGLDRRTVLNEGAISDIRGDIREMRGKFDLINEKLQDILDRLPNKKIRESFSGPLMEKKDGG